MIARAPAGPSRRPSGVIRVPIVAIVVAAALAGCGAPAPSPAGAGSVSITVVRGDNLFLGSHQEARIVAGDGSILAGAEVPADRAAILTAPAGEAVLEAFTVFVSDFGECGPDPAAPSRERCIFPTLEPKAFCRLPLTLRPGPPIAIRLTVLDGGACRLEPGPPDGTAPGPT